MEWVEKTARTVDEAKDFLLDQLGVDEQETEFEILEEPKPGLFGRTKGQARVRARVKPKTPPSRDDRRRRPSKTKDRGGNNGAKPESVGPEPKKAPADDTASPKRNDSAKRADRPERDDSERLPSDVARTEAIAFLQGLLDAFEMTASVAVEIDEEGNLIAAIDGDGLGRLIGPRGGVISAIEELTRTRLQHAASGGSTPRFKLDIGGYRASRRANLELLVDDVVLLVRDTGQPHILDVTTAAERKLVHDRVAETAADLRTHSEGDDPVRRVVLSPA
ncbi:MAG: Jag N-terminal domain-containing protein [Microthrixaceae bacterium]|nr:Jag N-terminal domain-containing protein [Microthrixaceae bacterium]